MKLKALTPILMLGTALVVLAGEASAQTKLRLITWSDYAPADVIADFKKETGIEVEVTTSNNEEIISKLRATGGSGFDLAQPSADRIIGPQAEFGIYKPLDMSKIKQDQFIASMLAATQKNGTFEGKVYSVPHIWGTDGLVVNTKLAPNVKDYKDICAADLAGKVSYRAKRPALLGFALGMGIDPFALYNDAAKYQAMAEKVGEAMIACKKNVKFFWDGKDQLITAMQAGEVTAALGWDTIGWRLNADNPDFKFIAPKAGALGWVDTFAIPAKGRADDAAYAWINFNMRPEIAARVATSAGNFTASKGADALAPGKQKDQFAASFPQADLDNVKWYPAAPAGIEAIDGKVLDKVRAAN